MTVLATSAVDEPDLLAMVADDWTPLGRTAADRFRQACLDEALAHDRRVDPNGVRERLLVGGVLDIDPRTYSALWSTACASGGYLAKTDELVPIAGEGSMHNGGKSVRVRRWIAPLTPGPDACLGKKADGPGPFYPLPPYAVISKDGLYRYTLGRRWTDDLSVGSAVFVMLNPSTADAETDDPTIRRCIGFAKALGCGGLHVVNLYAYRATKPADMFAATDPVGPDNDGYLADAATRARDEGRPVIAAWGANARPERVAQVLALPGMELLSALGLTKAGAPRHPLYLPATARPTPFTQIPESASSGVAAPERGASPASSRSALSGPSSPGGRDRSTRSHVADPVAPSPATGAAPQADRQGARQYGPHDPSTAPTTGVVRCGHGTKSGSSFCAQPGCRQEHEVPLHPGLVAQRRRINELAAR